MKPWEKPPKDRKRETSSLPVTSPSIPRKKNRTANFDLPSTSTKSEEASDVDILTTLRKADQAGNVSQAETCILDYVQKIRSMKEDSVDYALLENILRAASSYPDYFTTTSVSECLIDLVRSSTTTDNKLKPHLTPSILPGLAINLLTIAFMKTDVWPTTFIDLWIDDSSSNRQWVDRPLCELFVENLVLSFGTKESPAQLLVNDLIPGLSKTELKEIDSELSSLVDKYLTVKISKPRFVGQEAAIGDIIVNSARDSFQLKLPEIQKNLLRTLSSACGLLAVRTFVVPRLEQWMHNPKWSRNAQHLLLSLCVNANCTTSADAEVVVAVSKLRVKTKTLTQFYFNCVGEMVKDSEDNMRNVLSQAVYNELSLVRNPNNLTMLGSIIPSSPEAFVFLADIVMDLLQKKEDFLSAIRLILREIVRASRYECNLVAFADGLLKARELAWRDAEVRERAFKAVAELTTILMFLSLSPSVREAASVRGDDKDLDAISGFHGTVSKIQEEALRWLYLVVPKMYLPAKKDYLLSINKILMKDPNADLQCKDGWPQENEKALFTKLCLQTPLTENSLIWILFQGIPKQDHCQLNLSEILDLAESMIMKAATNHCMLPLHKLEIIELLFRLTQYKYPENISLPAGYEPPKLAVLKSYWRVWILLCVIASFNPETLGKVSWESYPTLNALMEMCMTNHFSFPTPGSTGSLEDTLARERQIACIEKEQILEFEGYLAAASSKNVITEKSSLLLSQLLRLDPLGVFRCPPQSVLNHLQSLNDRLKLGHNLCRSRSPDFLVDLIQRNSQPMPWLSELVSEGAFENLPVQCLCEFLLGQTARLQKSLACESVRLGHDAAEGQGQEKSLKKCSKESIKEDAKGLQLVHFLKEVVHGHSWDSVREVLEYFLRRLYSPKTQNRHQALQALQILLSSTTKATSPDENWLSDCIPNLRVFPEMQELITSILRQAIQIESEPMWIARYIEFLGTWGFIHTDSEIDSIALDVAQLVVERNCIVTSLLSTHHKIYDSLFGIFLSFIKKAREPQKESYKWCDGQDQILLKWVGDQLEATVNILIIHAIVILLSSYSSCLSNPESKSKQSKDSTQTQTQPVELKYGELMDIWFPRWKENSPKGFLLNTSEEAILYPDWIKLRMIRSDNSRLLSEALTDIEIDQLLLFVQSFGIPIKSMTALLLCVDSATEKDERKVSAAVGDAQYMNTLVQMQWSRGAKGGEKFAELLKTVAVAGGGPEVESLSQAQVKAESMVTTRPVLSIAPGRAKHVKKRDPTKYNLYFDDVYPRTPVGIGSKKHQTEELMDTTQNGSVSVQRVPAKSMPSNGRGRSTTTTSTSWLLPHSHQMGRGHKIIPDSVGHAVDRMVELDLCTSENAVDAHLPLLFGRNELPYQALLLTVLIHESSWTTVEKYIQMCLQAFNVDYNPSAVLDLIASTITNPKLWQGCDKYVPKHNSHISVFKLSAGQLEVMAEYIMEEISGQEKTSLEVPVPVNSVTVAHLPCPTQSLSTTKRKHCIQDRVKLWVQCCFWSKVTVDETVHRLMRTKSKTSNIMKFVSQVYLEYPEIITQIDFTSQDEINIEEEVPSVLDNVTHSLIYAVATVQPGKESRDKVVSEVEQCLRKVASTHPRLLLRQLNLIRTLLEGRTHLESSLFYAQNHHVPFQVFLGLLELIQSHLLNHMALLEPILVLYIALFKNYGHQKDCSSTLGRFAALIHNLLRVNPSGMRQLLFVHYEGLRELSKVKYYEELGSLQNLMNSLVPPSAGSELSVLTSSEGNDASLIAMITTELQTKMKDARRDEELIPILQELDSCSSRNPVLLNQFTDTLIQLLRSGNEACRNQVFTLILKHMTSCPETSRLYLESILKVLQDRESLNNNLAKRFNEFVVLSQEHGEGLLKEIFQMGIASNNVNVLPTLSKVITFLRVQKSQL